MATKKKTKGKLPWHSAFFAGIQIEFEKEAEKLIFENEHQLGTDPMRIDVVVIKKHTEEQIQKNIGRIFREYNIIEYKSPEQYLSIDAFYKVLGYACFYKSDVQHVDAIKVDGITISYISKSYPRKLIQHLKAVRGYELVPQGNGIWYIEGGMFPMQLIVTSKLSKEDNFWLKNLTNDLKKKEEADELFEEYGKHSNSNLHKSIMDLVMRANKEVFKEAKGNMCDALYELFEDEFKEATTKGRAEGSKEKLLELIEIKRSKGKSVEQIADDLEETVETIQELMKTLN